VLRLIGALAEGEVRQAYPFGSKGGSDRSSHVAHPPLATWIDADTFPAKRSKLIKIKDLTSGSFR
jgi:hypothetical protein